MGKTKKKKKERRKRKKSGNGDEEGVKNPKTCGFKEMLKILQVKMSPSLPFWTEEELCFPVTELACQP